MLTDAQQRQFFDQGYVVVNDVFDPADILAPIHAEYNALLDSLIANWQSQGLLAHLEKKADFYDKLRLCYEAGCDWFQPLDISLPGDTITANTPMHFGPAVFNMITYAPLLDIVETLIGPEITSNPIQHVRLKPPATSLKEGEIRAHITATDWHQDRGVGHAEADSTDMVTVWIAINDATPENGCLQVIPFDKHASLLPHCGKSQTAIADGFIDMTAARALPVKAGGIVLFHPLAPHSSLVNQTDRFRWSFDIRFNRTGQPTGRAHFPNFIARSKMRPELALTDWRKWKELWEDARERLADTPHIPIHRWASDAPYCA